MKIFKNNLINLRNIIGPSQKAMAPLMSLKVKSNFGLHLNFLLLFISVPLIHYCE